MADGGLQLNTAADSDVWQWIRDRIRQEEQEQNAAPVPEPESMVESLTRQIPGVGLAATAAKQVRRGINRLPTPAGAIGGLGALLFIAIVLRLALLPVRDDGTTSLGLIFLAMTGRARLGGSSSIPDVPPPPVMNAPYVQPLIRRDLAGRR